MCSWTGCRQRWGKRGNYHIERGEDGGEGFKIDLIFLDPLHPSSPPCFLSFHFFFFWQCTVSMLCLVLSDTRRAQRRAEMETDGKTGRGSGARWTVNLFLGKVQVGGAHLKKNVAGIGAELMTFVAAAGLPFPTAALLCGETAQSCVFPSWTNTGPTG